MSNYTQITDFSVKDGLTTGDPEKLILGSDVDAELAAIAAAITSKYDDADVASNAQAAALSLDSVLITPAKLKHALENGTFTLSANASAGALLVPSSRTITAGNGLSGGGDLTANRTLDVDLNELATETTAASGDFLAMVDITDNGSGKITLANFALAIDSILQHDNLGGFVANEHIDHSAVSISAGTGLTGGGTIAANRTLSLDTGNSRNVYHSAVSISSGDGLSGGGTIAATRTLSVDSTVVRTTGSQTIGGAKTFTSTLSTTGNISVGNDLNVLAGDLEVGEEVAFSGTLTNSSTGLIDNATSTAASIIRFTGSGIRTLTGIAGGYAGRILVILNDTASNGDILNLSRENAGSTAANRIQLTTDFGGYALEQGEGIMLIYDGGNSRWQVLHRHS